MIYENQIMAACRNVIVGMNFPELLKCLVDRDAPLLTGEPINKMAEEEKL